MTQELHRMWKEGFGIQKARVLFYAIRWYKLFSNQDLPYAFMALKGYLRSTRSPPMDIDVWEHVLLVSHALVTSHDPRLKRFQMPERLATGLGILLAFDIYGRTMDLPTALAAELRPPARTYRNTETGWTLNLFPSRLPNATEDDHMLDPLPSSKVHAHDDMVTIGASHLHRRWLSVVCAALYRMPRKGPLLLDMTPARYLEIYKVGRQVASVAPRAAHKLRSSGASADAIAGVGDAEMLGRGRWNSLKSLARYRRPAAYHRAMASLTPSQSLLACEAESELPRVIAALWRKNGSSQHSKSTSSHGYKRSMTKPVTTSPGKRSRQ